MTKKFKPSDLKQSALCGVCSAPMKLNGAPIGEPAFLLMIGHCHHCGESVLDVRTNDRVRYLQPPALQLAAIFLKASGADDFPPAANSPM